jgi:hypothetical protein
MTAVTVGYGRNDRADDSHQAAFVEATRRRGRNSLYGRVERAPAEAAAESIVGFTLGGVHNIHQSGAFELGLGSDITWYAMPDALRVDHEVCSATGCGRVAGYGARPLSAHVFLRLRTSDSGHMLNMRMAKPMTGHK